MSALGGGVCAGRGEFDAGKGHQESTNPFRTGDEVSAWLDAGKAISPNPTTFGGGTAVANVNSLGRGTHARWAQLVAHFSVIRGELIPGGARAKEVNRVRLVSVVGRIFYHIIFLAPAR